ncbi:Transcription factor PERIANTHIA, partial [Linum perenne]
LPLYSYFSLLFSSSLCFCNQSKTSLSIQTPSLPAVSAFIITDTIFLGLFTTFSSLLLVIHKTPFLLSFPYSEDMHSFKSATASSSSSSSSSHRHHHHTIPSTMFHHPSQMYCSTSPVPPSFFFRGGTEEEEEECRSQTQFADLGEIHHPQQPSHLPPPPPPPFYHHDALDLTPSSINATLVPSTNTPHFVSTFNHPGVIGGGQIAECMETGEFMYRKGTSGLDSNSGMAADNSHHTDTSTDVDTTDDTNHQLLGNKRGSVLVVDSIDQKSVRRLAQNREAARKSRLRKKAYVQQLENSRLRLAHLEQELQRARQQILPQGNLDHGHSMSANGGLAFDMEYVRWLDEHQRLINDLRSAVNSQMADSELRVLVEGVMAHYDEIFRLKSIAAKTDVFGMLSGRWKTPAERCLMWLGGFRSSELLKILGNQLEPLTDHQLVGICNLQQSSQQAEDALSQGMEALQQSLVDTLSSAPVCTAGSGNVTDYMGQMAIGMGKLATLENFLHQADLLRQQTLQQLHRILTTRQAARALLAISDYSSRLRALSSLWLARPRN